MTKICGIYKITSPSNRIYIGQSRDVKDRFKGYRMEPNEKQSRLYQSFKKYGQLSHKFEIIEECDFDQLNNRERFWQDHYQVLGNGGLNCKLIAAEGKPFVMDEETKKRVFANLGGIKYGKDNPSYGKPKSAEAKKRMSLAKVGKYVGEKSPSFGKKLSDQCKAKISESRKGKYMGMQNWKARIILDKSNGVFYCTLNDVINTYGGTKSIWEKRLSGQRKNKTSLSYV